MPESPEVHALADALDERTRGRTIVEFDVLDMRAVKTRPVPPSTLVGGEVRGVTRLGKHLDVDLGMRHLGISLGRHGWVRWSAHAAPGAVTPPALASVTFDDGAELQFTDAGSWVSLGFSVVTRPDEVSAVAKLGPDPADAAFDQAALDAVLVGRRKQLKAVLQEQESLAGIGNAYSDEILHLARLSPVVSAATLDAGERERLYRATVETLRGAIVARRGITIDRLKSAKVESMRVHGRAGAACPVCGGLIRDLAFGGTTAQYCATCQTGGAVLG